VIQSKACGIKKRRRKNSRSYVIQWFNFLVISLLCDNEKPFKSSRIDLQENKKKFFFSIEKQFGLEKQTFGWIENLTEKNSSTWITSFTCCTHFSSWVQSLFISIRKRKSNIVSKVLDRFLISIHRLFLIRICIPFKMFFFHFLRLIQFDSLLNRFFCVWRLKLHNFYYEIEWQTGSIW
jgi:hypothetical protein